jgi:hypothetical protein
VATSLGFSQDKDGNLYQVFSDGSKKLIETGYEARVLRDAKAANEKLYGSGGNVTSTASTTTTVAASTVTATPATATATTTVTASTNTQVKTATKDIILFDDGIVPVNLMADLIFEDIGGEELISIARRDTVNGQKITYQPIKNLSSIEQEYNPNNIISLQATADKYFANFPIKLDNRIPETGTGSNGDYVYIEPTTGNLVIEVVNLELDEQVEIQIATNGTIYETDFNEGAF